MIKPILQQNKLKHTDSLTPSSNLYMQPTCRLQQNFEALQWSSAALQNLHVKVWSAAALQWSA